MDIDSITVILSISNYLHYYSYELLSTLHRKQCLSNSKTHHLLAYMSRIFFAEIFVLFSDLV
jgi:hypothetical protein